MGILDDTSLDERAKPIVSRKRVLEDLALYARAAMIEEAPSPAMLEDAAQWLAIADDLAAAGFTPEEILRVAFGARRYGRFPPDKSMLAHLFAFDGGHRIAIAVCNEIIGNTDHDNDEDNHVFAAGAITCLANAGPLELKFAKLFGTYLEPSMLRAVVAAMPPDDREEIVLAHAVSFSPRNAAYTIDKLLWITDLVPAVRERFPELLRSAEGDREVEKLDAEIQAGTQRVLESRPTARARMAMKYWEDLVAKRKRAAEAYALAQRAYSRAITVDAPELATIASWIEAGPKRQKQIAATVAKTLSEHVKSSCKVIEIASHGGPPIATISLGERRFCLVPGGTFEMGFSEEEEAAVRASSEVNADADNHFEQYEQLFDQVHLMRPITRVRIGPMLVEQRSGQAFELDIAADILETGPFRIPSEAEWEYCARGGKLRELTYRGDVVPDHEEWFAETAKLGVKGANQFGLFGFGFEPELCADVWHESLDDVPVNGSPRTGDGQRVVRGGAAQWYPWQSTGEWHMLLSAFRMPASKWGLSIAMRFVLGIDCGSTLLA